MDNDSETNVNTGEVKNFMYGKEAADQMDLPYEYDDTINIPRNEYDDLLDDSVFLHFLEKTVGPDVWDAAHKAYDEWNETNERQPPKPPKLSLVE